MGKDMDQRELGRRSLGVTRGAIKGFGKVRFVCFLLLLAFLWERMKWRDLSHDSELGPELRPPDSA